MLEHCQSLGSDAYVVAVAVTCASDERQKDLLRGQWAGCPRFLLRGLSRACTCTFGMEVRCGREKTGMDPRKRKVEDRTSALRTNWCARETRIELMERWMCFHFFFKKRE